MTSAVQTQTTETPATFESMNLPKALLSALARINFTTPTPIQAMAIPPAIEGKDILGTAQTGTGKTAAFVIPLIAYLTKNTTHTAIIMTPTRELAQQVSQMIQPLLDRSIADGIRSAILIGGASMHKQLDMLKRKPRIIIGTPGRINDHLERRSLNLSKAHFLVLDETDRMLDMGFGKQIDRILSFMPAQRQTLLFSATLPPEILKLSEKYLRHPARIAAGEVSRPAAKVKQDSRNVHQGEKYEVLIAELDTRTGSVIIFVRTKYGADKLARKLIKDGHAASPIHGDLRQNQRTKAIAAFRSGESRILVATDVAARGLDIPHVAHVINHDLPQVPEDYIHRIGRTGRAGAEGEALSFVSPEEQGMWRDIQRLLNPGERPVSRSPEENRGEGRRRATSNPPRNKYANKRKRFHERPENNRHRDDDRDDRRGPKREFREGPKNFRPREDRYDNNGGQTHESRPNRSHSGQGKGWKVDRDRQDKPREDNFRFRDRDDRPRSDRRDGPRAHDDRPRHNNDQKSKRKPHRKGTGGFGGHAHRAKNPHA